MAMSFLEKLFGGSDPPAPASSGSATRWEKAVTALNGVSKQIARSDPDGVDVYCFPGTDGGVDKYANIRTAEELKSIIAAQEPGGPCTMASALELAFNDAFERSFEKPCEMLVITAGQPEDAGDVMEMIQSRAQQLEKDADLEMTVVHVGDDPEAEAFLEALNNDLTYTSSSGETIDMVDVVKDEDLKKAMDEMRDPSFMESGGTGALLGAFAGMAVGAAGYYFYSKQQAKKRTAGWNGTWEVYRQPGDEATGVQLNVTDDGEGGLAIEGYPDDGSAGDPSAEGKYEETDEELSIYRVGAGGGYIAGTVVDEHEIEWQDNTVWKEVPPEGVDWTKMAAAGAAGAMAGGAAGYLMQKKFFKKAGNNEPSNYVIVIDRSEKMSVMDG